MNLTGDVRLAQNKCISTSLKTNNKSSSTPYINLQLFEDCEEDQLDNKDNQCSEIIPNKQLTDHDNMLNIRNHRTRSNSLDNPSHRSSATDLPMDTTRNVLTRRGALDPTEQHKLRTYVRHRKNSIVQHVIGYNYDDKSIVGGLYTRIGIGSKLNKNIEITVGHLNGSF